MPRTLPTFPASSPTCKRVPQSAPLHSGLLPSVRRLGRTAIGRQRRNEIARLRQFAGRERRQHDGTRIGVHDVVGLVVNGSSVDGLGRGTHRHTPCWRRISGGAGASVLISL